MIPNAQSRRFDRRWLVPAIETDGAELFEPPDASPYSVSDESTNDPAGGDFDEALEQIALDRCRVCPLCGAMVARDGPVER